MKNLLYILIAVICLLSNITFSQFKIGFSSGLNFAGSKITNSIPFPNETKNIIRKDRASVVVNLTAETFINSTSSLRFKFGVHSNKDTYLYTYRSIYSQAVAQIDGIAYQFERIHKVRNRFFRASVLHQSYLTIIEEDLFFTFNMGGGLAYSFNNPKVDVFEVLPIFEQGDKLKTVKPEDSFLRRENIELFLESSLGFEYALKPNLRMRFEGTYLAGLDDLNPTRSPISREIYENYNVMSSDDYGYFTRSFSLNLGISFFFNN